MGLELITMGASALLTTFINFWKQSKADAHERMLAMMRIDELNYKAIVETNKVADSNKLFNLTKNIIALSIVGFYLMSKWVAAHNGIDIFVPEEYVKNGFSLFGVEIFKGSSGTKMIPLHGLVILPIDYHLLFAVVGSYFGYVASRR